MSADITILSNRLNWLLLLLMIVGCSEQQVAPTVGASAASATSVGTPESADNGDVANGGAAQFAAPIQLSTVEGPVTVESPGYASPCWADVDHDGVKELLVGQFNGGKIRVYEPLEGLTFAPGKWLEAGGDVAEVPGVW